jgi:hypothetical protein
LTDQEHRGPAADVIKDFRWAGRRCVLDLRDLLQGNGTDSAAAISLSQYLHFSDVGGKAILSVDPGCLRRNANYYL